jgi:hypothetical protein
VNIAGANGRDGAAAGARAPVAAAPEGHIPSAVAAEHLALSDRRIAALRRAARELEAAALPHDAAAARTTVAEAFDRAMRALCAGERLPGYAEIRAALDACGTGAAHLVPLEWGREHFVHQFLTREFVDALAGFIARLRRSRLLEAGAPARAPSSPPGSVPPHRSPVLEVGAGRGDLARGLRERGLPVVASDDGSWLGGRRSWPGALPADVEPLPYAVALARYQPGIVLCAWMPLGEDWTPAFRACPAVADYILIGEGPGGCTGTPESFAAPPPWRRTSLRHVARWGLTRNADRAFSTSVDHFHRPAR